MKKFYIIGFLVLLCFDTLAQTSFKMAAVSTGNGVFDIAWILRLLTEKWIYIAVAAYLGAFVTYMTVLKHAPVGPAFAATHLEIVTVMMVSYFFLNEKLNGLQVFGSLLIIVGIMILGFEKEEQPAQLASIELKDAA